MRVTPNDTSARSELLAAARIELVAHGHAAISLRAVARRAGVSHAAPTYFFGDRAGMLTAVATRGFQDLFEVLRAVVDSHPSQPLAALGGAYIRFGLENAALFDLMFRPSELNSDDADLLKSRSDAIGVLNSTASAIAPESTGGASSASLMSWALVHGLVVLTRDGELQAATGAPTPNASAEIALQITSLFAARLASSDEPDAPPE